MPPNSINAVLEVYYCPICGWIGTKPEELAGFLWDYEMHDSCPDCWENEVVDNPVECVVIVANISNDTVNIVGAEFS